MPPGSRCRCCAPAPCVVEADAVGQDLELSQVKAVSGAGPERAVVSFEPGHLVVEDEVHTRQLAQPAAQLASLFVQHIAEKARAAHQPGHLGALAKLDTLRQLIGDEAPAQHQHPLRGIRPLDDGVGVVDGLEAVDLGDLLDTGPGRRERAATGGDQRSVVAELVAPVGAHDLLTHVHLGRPGLEMEVDPAVRVRLKRPHEHLLAAYLAAQIAGQGDPVIEGMALGGDDRDRAGVVVLAQLLRAPLTGDPVPQDHVAAVTQRSSSSASRRVASSRW